MISVRLFKRNGSIVRVSAEGHSGYGEHGNDIVCAAVSAVVQTAYLAIKDAGGQTDYVRESESGLFEFTVGSAKRHDCDVILRAMTVGLQDLAEGFPQNIELEESTCL